MRNALRMYRGEFEAQLSILEREAGNVDQAAPYMSKAQEDLKAVGWIDYSEANILRTFSRQPVPPCGNSLRSATAQTASRPAKPCG
jgi:hypothetical protein